MGITNAFPMATNITLAGLDNIVTFVTNDTYAFSPLWANTSTGSEINGIGPAAFLFWTPGSAHENGTWMYIKKIYFKNVLEVGNGAFNHLEKLEEVDLPNCILLSVDAFQGCTNLTKVNLPLCTSINEGAFMNCRSLSNISLPLCFTVGLRAFMGCWNLTSISLPECKYIRSEAFWACYKLRSISLPRCVALNSGTFSECKSLSAIYLMNYSVVTLATSTFTNSPITNSAYLGYFGSIYVPASLYHDYIIYPRWSNLAARIVSV